MIKKNSNNLLEICKDLSFGKYDTVYLGGSMGRMNGQVSLSDYDVVVMVPRTTYPMSYNNIDVSDGRRADIIIRCPETLAFEAEASRIDGKATVLQTLAKGQVLAGRTEKARLYAQYAEKVIEQGPHPLSLSAYEQKIHALYDRTAFAKNTGIAVQTLAAMEVLHEGADLFLRSKRQWTANGKILARNLEPFRDFKAGLEGLFETQQYGVLPGYVEDAISLTDLTVAPVKDICMEYAARERNETARDSFLVRYSDRHLADCLHSDDDSQRQVAGKFLSNKLLTIASAVDVERLGRPTNEYFYALARVVITMAKAVQAVHGGTDEKRYHQLLQQYGDFYEAVTEARTGQPDKLKHIVQDFTYNHFGCESIEVFHRFSPSTFRFENHGIQ